MRTDIEIRAEGFLALINTLGAVEAERFIALIHRESFDYTEWRQTQWSNETVTSLADRAEYCGKTALGRDRILKQSHYDRGLRLSLSPKMNESVGDSPDRRSDRSGHRQRVEGVSEA